MTRTFERTLNEAIEELYQYPTTHHPDALKIQQEIKRTIAILSAISGYMSENGTTWEQDQLLKEIGIKQ